MNRSRKRKSIATDNGSSKNEPKPKRIKTRESYEPKKTHSKVIDKNSPVAIANVRDVRVILDRSIIDKYFHAKQVLRDILSPKPIIVDRQNDEKSAKSNKQTSFLDYLHVKNKSTRNDSRICQINKEVPELSADVVEQDNTRLTYDVNIMPQPQIMYYMANSQSNCFLMNNSLVVIPANAQFTPKEFIYNNCSVLPVMELPIKTEFPKNWPIKEELIDDTSMNSSITVCDHELTNFEDISEASIPIAKSTSDDQTTKPCDSDDQTKSIPVKFDNRGFPICPKCDRSFKKLESFKQHKLLCGLEFLYECLYCEYSTKFSNVVRKHVERMHKMEVKNKDVERILKEIRKRRLDKKTLSLIFKESEVDSGTEESFVKSIESNSIPSKLTFDRFCPRCEQSFKRINRIPMKICPDCQVTLVFKCRTCGDSFLSYSKAYHHVINKCGGFKKVASSRRTANYNCEHCDFKTSYKGVIREHIFQCYMKKDKSMYFKCEFCSFQTCYENNFKRHRRKVHLVDLDD